MKTLMRIGLKLNRQYWVQNISCLILAVYWSVVWNQCHIVNRDGIQENSTRRERLLNSILCHTHTLTFCLC